MGENVIAESSVTQTFQATVDWNYLQAVEGMLSEWNSPEDDAAYGDLKQLA
ncbi:MAG: hypothetical protein WCD18_19540 [Thermosynechococcaceae cyanobacterium]